MFGTPTCLRLAAAALWALALLTTATQTGAAESKLIFSIADPQGDDTGDGTILYPSAEFINPGDLDLVELSARVEKDGTQFEATFARPIKVAGRETVDAVGTDLRTMARFGIYTFNLDIYIDTDREPGSGHRHTLAGRNAEIAADTAWEKAVILTPRPYEALDELERSLTRKAKEELRQSQARIDPEDLTEAKEKAASDVEGRVFFPTRIRVLGRTVRFLVPDWFLEGPARDDWSYVVALSASDLYVTRDVPGFVGLDRQGPAGLGILPVAPGQSPSLLGSRREETDLLPPLIDILVPRGMKQKEVLRDYDQRTGRRVALPGVVPAALD
jgi:hypothetical protein